MIFALASSSSTKKKRSPAQGSAVGATADPSGVPSTEEVRLHGLMVQSLQGDPEAYRTLLNELQTLLKRYFKSRVGTSFSSASADELVQEVLLSVHEKRHTFAIESRFFPWFYAIARYRWIDFLRRDWRTVSVGEASDFDLIQSANGHEEFEVQDPLLRDQLGQALDQLPEKQRETVRLTKILGFSVDEVAEKTGWKTSDIKVSVHRGLRALRKILAIKLGNDFDSRFEGDSEVESEF